MRLGPCCSFQSPYLNWHFLVSQFHIIPGPLVVMKEEEENASNGTDSTAEGEVKTETGLNKRPAIANCFILTLLNFHPDS